MGYLAHKDGSRATRESLVDLLKKHKLTVNDVKGAAADRGTNVHTALEQFAENDVRPDPTFYPEHERGYVKGLLHFIDQCQIDPVMSEVMVAGVDGYAGRFDLIAELKGEVVVKTYPKRAPVTKYVDGRWLIDLKTSKGVYPSYHLQLAAYEQGLEECGYEPVDHSGVLRVTADGQYELVEGKALYDEFEHVLNTYNAIEEIKKR